MTDLRGRIARALCDDDPILIDAVLAAIRDERPRQPQPWGYWRAWLFCGLVLVAGAIALYRIAVGTL